VDALRIALQLKDQHHLAQRRGTRGRSCGIVTNWVSASYLTEIASISLNELVPLFVRRQNFLNALPDRSVFVLFQVDKIRLSREMATNISKLRQRRLVQTLADPKSMKNSSLRYFFNRVHLAHFDVGVRKLMFEWRACSHRILIARINRISSTIDLEDVVLMRETAIRRDASFHGGTPSISSEALCARRDTVRSAGISRRSRV
jgi:hypothetical protein